MVWLDRLGQSKNKVGNNTLTFTARQCCYSKGMSFQLSCGLMKYFSGYTHVVTFRLICWPLPDVHHTIPRRSKQEAGFGVIVYLLCNKNSFSSDILLFIIMFVRLCLLLQWKQFLFFALLGILLETLSLSLLTNEFSDFPFVSIVREENLLPW